MTLIWGDEEPYFTEDLAIPLSERGLNLKLLHRSELMLGRVTKSKVFVMGDHSNTYFLCKALGAKAVVSIDAHTDLMRDEFDHASWLYFSLRDFLKKAAIIAPVLMIPSSPKTELGYFQDRVRIYPYRRRYFRRRRYMNLEDYSITEIVNDLSSFLSGCQAHLTVDLDVLTPEYNHSRFQHGELGGNQLLNVLEHLLSSLEVKSIDFSEVVDPDLDLLVDLISTALSYLGG
ncbi:arginase family protein [Thermococci archaeon]|nr:MAG: arginase family protein [Thermococci archaeon]